MAVLKFETSALQLCGILACASGVRCHCWCETVERVWF